jgi:hypothetical protein
MKTMTKKLAVLAFAAAGLIGCAESNEKNVMKDDTTGQQQTGVTPPNAARTSADFMKNNKGAMNDPKKAQNYKNSLQ